MLLAQPLCDTPLKPEQNRVRVLVLCTGNSARSIMAEAILNSIGSPLFRAYSAGSHPTGKVNPLALEQISQLTVPDNMDIRSKSWHEFTGPKAPQLDLVLTVCDNAAGESCPAFVGHYEHIHWGFPDPAGSSDDKDQERAAFVRCFQAIQSRVERLVSHCSANDAHKTIINAMRKLA